MGADRRRTPGRQRVRPFPGWTACLLIAATALVVHTTAAAASDATGQPTDDSLRQLVIERVFDARAAFFTDIRIDVIGGDALLTGRVATVPDKARATALVRSVPGVQTVINEIHVGAAGDTERIARDLLLERRIRQEMRNTFGSRIPRLAWCATDGVVYVFGHAGSEWEHNKALSVIKQTPGVGRVVDYLKITAKDG